MLTSAAVADLDIAKPACPLPILVLNIGARLEGESLIFIKSSFLIRLVEYTSNLVVCRCVRARFTQCEDTM